MSLRRNKPLAQGKPLARTSKLKRGKGLRSRSAATQKAYRDERVPLVIAILEERPWCELQFPGCTARATCVDEIKQRSRGGSITDPANLAASCIPCNGYKEDHPAEALARGLALHSWDEVPNERA
jgi:hypothetical protein